MTAHVELRQISKQYGAVRAVLPTDLDIQKGEFLAILGPSGCGKTTLLRMIGGFVMPSGGTITLEGQDVTRLKPEARPTNMVFQGYGLFPHMTVAQNVGYGLRLARVPDEERKRRVQEALSLVHLGDFGPRSIDQMSGGQRQRVALARALVMQPKVLLLDEPLAALDLKLRKAMQEEFRRIHSATGGTFIFVTHDQEEAMSLANRICVMEGGRIVQSGSPQDIYLRPQSRFISRFIGEANFFRGQRKDGKVTLENGLSFADAGKDAEIDCVVRPENMGIRLNESETLPADFDLQIVSTVEEVVFLGPYTHYKLATQNGERIIVEVRDQGQNRCAHPGAKALIGWRSRDHTVLTE
ncbi:ABC transporter ATP-binding protein [Rhizobiales bacterium]|uniref:ABC transporter ATP-binding protein n=1 Tax=Hongsoonwoonella zoysiae TaxID=2821844 RepID=UPI0015617C53|nr:ABC transporter ATP-binding protein [Hongsoonwoonella zoysiae]NRG17751.1 ABC transporter ATP-binding protein [Hongsoonwoonella zoysiae]